MGLYWHSAVPLANIFLTSQPRVTVMITILGRRNSANVQKVMWTLGELQLPYRREDIGGSFGYPDEYPNPTPVVPTLKDGDIVMWESNACVRYLARTYGAGSLWPNDPADLATSETWMEWQRSDISLYFFPLFQMLIRGLPSTPDKIERNVAGCGACFSQLDDRLAGRNFICGTDLTMADIVIGAMAFRYMTLPIGRPDLPHMTAWYDRLTARPAYQKHVMLAYGRNPEEWDAAERANASIQ
jgi:glutathione S-transferase